MLEQQLGMVGRAPTSKASWSWDACKEKLAYIYSGVSPTVG